MPHDLAGRSRDGFAAELRRLLREAERRPGRPGRFKRSALARRVGVSASSLYAYLDGTTLPPAGVLAALLRELEAPDADQRRLASAQDSLARRRRIRATPSSRGSAVPRQLPAVAPGFTGRTAYLDQLDALLRTSDNDVATVVVTAVGGTAGVGKTALVVCWAHRNRARFPDGQLFVNLRGYHPGQPTDPAEALTRLLAGLGLTGRDIPYNLEDRAARYRSELADKRVLIVLDNACSVEQVRPLLPGSGSGVVVVTSRDSLAGLVAVHGAHRLDLDRFPSAEAIMLLRRLIGPRADAEPDAVATLANQCAHLPLALRVAAELAGSRPATCLAELVAELDDRQRRLDLLNGADDPHAAVRTVFSWSIRHLPPGAAIMFRLLGLHPGPDLDRYAAAALAETSPADAHRRLELLRRAYLLEPVGPDRYGMHDLLRAYAGELTHTRDTEQVRHAAQGRLLDHYRYHASVAMDTAYPHERDHRPRIPATDTRIPQLSDSDRALSWLEVEHPNLLAVARHAAGHGWPAHVLALSATLHRHLHTRGRYGDIEALHQQALAVARGIGDRTGELGALTGAGWGYLLQNQYDEATEHLQQALDVARDLGDRVGELAPLRGLGWLHTRQGRLSQALDCYQQVLEIAHATGDRTAEPGALNGLAFIHQLQGRQEQAADHHQQALEKARAIGNRGAELGALCGLADMHRMQGQCEQAADHYQQALEIARAIGNRGFELAALNGLAHIHRVQGQHEQAADAHQRVLDAAREMGDRYWQFQALHGFGRLHHTNGSPGTALAHHRRALDLAIEIGQPADQARAHDGLAHAHHALGQPERARQHWQQALDILTKLGIDYTEDPEANTSTIRAHLAALSSRS